MAVIQMDVSGNDRLPEEQSVLEEVSALFGRETTPDEFLVQLLASQCRQTGALAAAILRPGKARRIEVVATHPKSSTPENNPRWIDTAAACAPDVIASEKTVIKPELPPRSPAGRSQSHVIVIPIQKDRAVRAVAAFLVQAACPEHLVNHRKQLEITSFLLNFYEMRWTLRGRHAAFDRISMVIEVLSAVNRSKRFMGAAMAICNESATRWGCSRVSLGFLDGRNVRVQAMSHTDKFSREMKLLQDMEAAMEECLDQDVEVVYPAARTAVYVSRAAGQLSKDHGPMALLSLPIRHDDQASAVLMLERKPERPFAPEEIEAIRLACDLCAPRLVDLREYDRWFGSRMTVSARRGLSTLLGPTHTWLKVCAVLIFFLAVFLTFAEGDYRIEAPFVFEAPVQQVVVAPFNTYIKSVSKVPGDEVQAGRTILGVLETSEVRLKVAALRAERLGYEKQMAAAMRDRKTAEAQIAQAMAEKAAAQIRLFEQQIEQATLLAPITGRIISEDLKRQIGAPVETGKVLFEIACIELLQAELYAPENLIADLFPGQQGELASVGHPEQRIGFVVERINPIADVVNHHNVFKVRARLLEHKGWMRPGMQGIAKISAGRKSYVWIASHRLVNWLRMKLWL